MNNGAKQIMRKNNNEHGFALIEVLIAALVLTTGAVAFLRLQTIGLQYSFNDYVRNQATSISRDFVEILRSNTGFMDLANNQTGYIIADKTAYNKGLKRPQENSDCKNSKPKKTCYQASLNYQIYLINQRMLNVMPEKRSILCYREHASLDGYIRITYIWRDNSNKKNTSNLTGKDCPAAFDTEYGVAANQERSNSVTIYAQI